MLPMLRTLALWLAASVVVATLPASAVEIKVLSSNNMKATVTALSREFERSTGNKLAMSFDSARAMNHRITVGADADVVIVQRTILEELLKPGKIDGHTITDVARSSLAVFVQVGAPKPDVSSAEAFKGSLLNARSISYPNPGAGALSGIAFSSILEKLGVAEQMKAKTKRAGDTEGMVRLVALGIAQIGVSQLSETRGRGIELAGRLPDELGGSIPISAAVTVGAREPEAAKTFIRFLSSPEALKAIGANRLEPPAN